ncbi:MAG TPA: adenylate/guanylate cyclase domain-containing protein [Candidatus Limnocylindria bacterium]
MPNLIVKRFDTPDERQEFALGYYELITVGALTMGREFLEPGWKWSTHVKPIVGTEWCEVRHVGFQVSGRWVCASRDGSEVVIGPGDAFDVAAGHDSWVLGDEPSVTIDFQGSDYAATPGSSIRILTTILFTDIVGSTAMAERLGDARWKRILHAHLEDVNLLLAAFRGTLIDTAGDGVVARFGTPADALRCALAIVQAARRQEIEVRAGVHTAEVELSDNAVRGVGVHLAARIMAAAAGSEILVSATVHELAAGTDLTFTERGSFELKGITGARTLYALDRPTETASSS